MPSPLRALSNDHQVCQLIKLDESERSSPIVVMQEGYAPNDPKYRRRMFYLQRDGQWIDEIARSTRPDSEIGDIVFETSGEAIKLLASLTGKPIVRELAVTEEQIQAYLDRMKKVTSLKAALREFLARYRAAKNRR